MGMGISMGMNVRMRMRYDTVGMRCWWHSGRLVRVMAATQFRLARCATSSPSRHGFCGNLVTMLLESVTVAMVVVGMMLHLGPHCSACRVARAVSRRALHPVADGPVYQPPLCRSLGISACRRFCHARAGAGFLLGRIFVKALFMLRLWRMLFCHPSAFLPLFLPVFSFLDSLSVLSRNH